MTNSLTPAEASADGLRGLRDRHGISRADLATIARRAGLNWKPATVSNIEQGRHEMKLAEAAALIGGLRTDLRLDVTVADLLPPDVYVAIGGEGRAVLSDALRSVLTDPTEYDRRWAAGRRSVEDGTVERAVTGSGEQVEAMLTAWPDATTEELRAAESAAYGVAEQNAAERLGVSPVVVSAAAFRLWGRSVTDERDARAADAAGESATRRQVQAFRGHVTRRLIEDLRSVVTPDE